MKTKRKPPTSLVRFSVMVPEDLIEALRDLADDRSEGKLAPQVRAALRQYVERERAAA